jgi:hypothetical protein
VHRARPTRTRLAALPLAALLATGLLAGCGSDDDDAPDAQATTSAAASVPAASDTPPTPAGDGTVLAEPTEAATPSTAATPTAETPTAEAPAEDVEAIEVSVVDGKVQPAFRRVEVERGTTVELTVTSDVADELHIHGYDEEAELAPGAPATVTFVADEDGVFEVETHETGLQLLALVVR